MDSVSDIVLATLQVNPDRVVSRRELILKADCSSRSLREAVLKLRLEGFLIVSFEAGYRFALNPEEINQVITSLERQERSLQDVIEAMREATLVQFGRLPARYR